MTAHPRNIIARQKRGLRTSGRLVPDPGLTEESVGEWSEYPLWGPRDCRKCERPEALRGLTEFRALGGSDGSLTWQVELGHEAIGAHLRDVRAGGRHDPGPRHRPRPVAP